MKTLPAIAIAAVAAAVAAAVWFVERPEPAVGDAGGTARTPSGAAVAASGSSSAAAPAGDPASTGKQGEGADAAAPAENGGRRVAGADVPQWPTAAGQAKTKARTAGLSGEPAIAVELASQALALVGIDPEAERTWRRAIDDPHMPANVRSDLIEDLNQEGFVDNSHPTSADLPLVLARLELIERLTPLARDDTNRAAFAEAYKDLLAMYVRLGGQPRPAPATGK